MAEFFLGEPSEAPNTLKRRASSTFDSRDDNSRKRLKEDLPPDETTDLQAPTLISGSQLADDLEQELLCGCCSALLYRPVIVYPCQHYFCGSCCLLWVHNGGTNCPACRSTSTSVSSSRVLQIMVDVLLRADPSRARTDREKQQADEIYMPGGTVRIPSPREASPEPTIPQSGDFARPCPHCIPGNRYGWQCPNPVPDPSADPEHAWPMEEGPPLGHASCGNCENLLAIDAPTTTTKCDMCQVYFCGIGVQHRCVAVSLRNAQPHGMSDVSDLIQSTEVYECFDGNAVEVEIMLDYLSNQHITPRHIYSEILQYILSQPRMFAPLIELDLFLDVHTVPPGPEPGIDAPRERICRMCATEVLLYGLKDWWVRERKKGFLDASVTERPDCPDGPTCRQQKEHVHAREFNHVFDSTNSGDSLPDQPLASSPPPSMLPERDAPGPSSSQTSRTMRSHASLDSEGIVDAALTGMMPEELPSLPPLSELAVVAAAAAAVIGSPAHSHSVLDIFDAL